MKQSFVTLAVLLLFSHLLAAQQGSSVPQRTLPTRLNAPAPLPPPPTNANPPAAAAAAAAPGAQPATTVITPPPPPVGPLLPNVLAFDAELKDYTTKAGEVQGNFTFYFTNVSSAPISITSASASCGCTVPKLPSMPWKIEPAGTGEIPVTMTVAGKTGTILKTVTINTDRGQKLLTVKVNVTPPDTSLAPADRPMDRSKNVELAKADRQAVFRGDCASCHVEKGRGKRGKELYAASCGICHDAEHRADMVPDLHKLKHDTNADYWRTWISLGKPGSLMPAFSHAQGGPLTDAEIDSLVQYLVSTIPAQATRAAAGN